MLSAVCTYGTRCLFLELRVAIVARYMYIGWPVYFIQSSMLLSIHTRRMKMVIWRSRKVRSSQSQELMAIGGRAPVGNGQGSFQLILSRRWNLFRRVHRKMRFKLIFIVWSHAIRYFHYVSYCACIADSRESIMMLIEISGITVWCLSHGAMCHVSCILSLSHFTAWFKTLHDKTCSFCLFDLYVN